MVNLAKEFATKNSGEFDFSENLSLSHFPTNIRSLRGQHILSAS